jgi:hypothetical protein
MDMKALGLEPAEIRRLKKLAAKLGKRQDELIAQAVRDYLAANDGKGYERMEYSPLWKIVGMIDDADAPEDGSLNHDLYIYGTPKKYRQAKDGTWERVSPNKA